VNVPVKLAIAHAIGEFLLSLCIYFLGIMHSAIYDLCSHVRC